MSGRPEHLLRAVPTRFQALLPERLVELSRLTETAAADTPAHDLESHPVLSDFDKGNQRGIRIIDIGHVPHHFASDNRRDPVDQRAHGADGAVCMIIDLIE